MSQEDDQVVNDDESGFYVGWKVAKDDELYPDERPTFTEEQAANQEYPCICHDNTKATFWVEYSTEEEDFCLWSFFPWPYAYDKHNVPVAHNVDFEIDESGLGYILNPDSKGIDDDLAWLKNEGIEPNTPFKVKVYVNYSRNNYLDSSDIDVDIDFEIIKEKR